MFLSPQRVFLSVVVGLLSSPVVPSIVSAQHDHDHQTSARKVTKPRVFLDKSPRVVAYQLKRLSDAQLLLVDRESTDEKYAPVYEAILGRKNLADAVKLAAAEGLADLHDTSPAVELLNTLGTLKATDSAAARDLIDLLLARPMDELSTIESDLEKSLDSKSAFQRSVSLAALLKLGRNELLDGAAPADSTAALAILPDAETRNSMRGTLLEYLQSTQPVEVRLDAIRVAPKISQDAVGLSEQLVGMLGEPDVRDAVTSALLKMPFRDMQPNNIDLLAKQLVDIAESTPVAKRTSDAFLRNVELSGKVISLLPQPHAKELRNRMRSISVRLIRIGTVEEEMRYDVKHFAVEAGSDVQIILDNHDLMPHNLVITRPGQLKQVANDGLAVGPTGGREGKGYVPDTDDVLFATGMVNAEKSERLTFTAPNAPGEYPYVCTFPQHWSRMYGVMVVVEDLDAFLADPFEPEDPIGSNRSFVAAWTVEDLKAELADGLRGRSPEIGKKIFVEASCGTCHKMAGQGGAVGPELTSVFTKWKDDSENILREILDPSACIDEKYAMHTILTVDGQTVSGLIASETDDEVTLINDPESGKPTVVAQDDVEEMIKMKTSMMPKGLMNQYTKDEILELMAYLKGSAE